MSRVDKYKAQNALNQGFPDINFFLSAVLPEVTMSGNLFFIVCGNISTALKVIGLDERLDDGHFS